MRQKQLQKLQKWRDRDVIKVVTGVRRCGKSTLLELFAQKLAASGVPFDRIIHLNLESHEFRDFDDRLLYQYLTDRLVPRRRTYLLLDEIQNIPQWERCISSLYLDKNIDIYLTGSNAVMLSGELATKLSGRYIEIKLLPLSFSEFATAQKEPINDYKLYHRYVTFGSFPYIINLTEPDEVSDYIFGILDSIVLKDIVARYQFRDIRLLLRVIDFLMDNVGNLCSLNKITSMLRHDGVEVSTKTLDRYLHALQEAYIFYAAPRYDVAGRQLLCTGEKYYVVDPGLRYFSQGRRLADRGRILENIVYLELCRRYRQVYVGKTSHAEIDFVTISGAGDVTYFQVAYSLQDDATREREFAPLLSLRDGFPRTVLTLDLDIYGQQDGINVENALAWLRRP